MGEENFLEEKNLIQKQRSYWTAFRNCGVYLIISVITSKRHALSLVK